MPNGRVMRIDAERGCAYVTRGGRIYEAPLSEVETPARIPGARVQYKLRRVKGVESAEQVELRSGTRTNKRQRRFGDLTGARAPGAKVKTAVQQAYGIDVTTQPFRVVAAWLAAMGGLDLDAATELYLPGAVINTDDGPVSGRSRIRSLLDQSPWLAVDPGAVELRGVDRSVRADVDDGDTTLVAYFDIADGFITEQWLGPEPDLGAEEDDIAIETIVGDRVDTSMSDYAREKLGALLQTVGGGARRPQFKLSFTRNPNRQTLARAEAKFDHDNTVLRAHAAAAGMTEAIDLVIDRLRNNLDHHQDRERHRATGLEPEVGAWRHGNLPTTLTPYFDRAVADREVVRHKSFAPDEATVDEALWDMALLDYDFYLFVELTTGLDCMLEQRSDGRRVVHVLTTDGAPSVPLPDGVDQSDVVPTSLRPSEAIRLLDDSGRPFVFFRNAVTERGNVIYRRYDGHYGLITPPSDDD
ncbi:MAG: sigma 54 modulation/S30EA ribosomal C-terminal domain-containing protein [Actinomycetota bacterium]